MAFETSIKFGGPAKVAETNLLSFFGPGQEPTPKQERKLSDLFQKLLSSGANTSNINLAAQQLAFQYPQMEDFQAGGAVANELLKRTIKGRDNPFADPNFLTQTQLGRSATKEERAFGKDVSPQEYMSYLTSSPEYGLTNAFSTPEHESYAGPLVPTKGPGRSVIYTGARMGLRRPSEFL